MELNKLSNDNAEVLLVEAQENGNQQLVFTTAPGDEFSPTATIKVGTSYNEPPLKTYGVGSGITLSNSDLTAALAYNPSDWGNANAFGDASLLVVSVGANKRDFKIKFTINPSFQ